MLNPLLHDQCTARWRRLAYVLVSMACALAATGWFYVRPMWQTYTELKDEVQELEEDAHDSHWPTNPKQLQNYLDLRLSWNNGEKTGSKQDFPGLKEEERRIVDRATKYLRQKIVENFPTIADENDWAAIQNFMRNSSRIDFKYLANRLEADFAEKNLQVPENIVQITESKPEPVYQKILQLWTVEFLFQTLADYDLQILTEGDTGKAAIQTLTPNGFILNKNDTEIYLWAFPVKVTVLGTIQNFLRFQQALISNSYFFPLRNLSIHTAPPAELPADRERLELNRQTITLTIASFFRPQDNLKETQRKDTTAN